MNTWIAAADVCSDLPQVDSWPQAVVTLGFLAFVAFLLWVMFR